MPACPPRAWCGTSICSPIWFSQQSCIEVFLCPFYRQGNRGSEECCNLLKVTLLVSGIKKAKLLITHTHTPLPALYLPKVKREQLTVNKNVFKAVLWIFCIVQINRRRRATKTQASSSSILKFISWIQNAPLSSPSWDVTMMLQPAAQEMGEARGSQA